MAGRLLPVALAIISGVAIGVSTFGEEFQEQQRRRLQEEYNRDIAAASASALPSDGPSPMASSTIPAPRPEQFPTHPKTTETSKISSILGFWAWASKDNTNNATKEQLPATRTTDASKQQP